MEDEEKIDMVDVEEGLNNLQDHLNRVSKLIEDYQKHLESSKEGLESGFEDVQEQISKMIVFLDERKLEQDFVCDSWGCPTGMS